MRLTVAGEMPSSAAICLPVRRYPTQSSPPARQRPAALAGANGVAANCDRSAQPGPHADSDQPTCERSAGRRPRFGNGRSRLPALDLPHNPLSTTRREPGILMHVHPVLSFGTLKLRQLQFPRSEPDGQPIESSQLERFPPATGLSPLIPAKAGIQSLERTGSPPSRGRAGESESTQLGNALVERTGGEIAGAVALDARDEIDFPGQIFAHRARGVAGALVGLEPDVDGSSAICGSVESG